MKANTNAESAMIVALWTRVRLNFVSPACMFIFIRYAFSYCVHVYICTGVMVENTLLLCCGQVDSRGGTIIGAGIEIQIPKGALKPGEHTTIAVHASIKSPSIQSNFHLISPIFHIKCVPHIQFKRDITLTIEHFAQLKTKSDLDDIVFLISKKGEEFHQSEQLKCHIESSHAKVNVAHFCEVTLGTKSGMIHQPIIVSLNILTNA